MRDRITILPSEVARPCPFCGAPAEIQAWHGGGRDKRLVSCSGEGYCRVRPAVTGSNRRRALAYWNNTDGTA